MGIMSKNSPQTTNASTTQPITNTDNKVITGGSGSTVTGGNTDISGVSNANINVSTTDQGAINAGLQIALAGIDSANTNNQSVIAASTANTQSAFQSASDLTSQAVGVAETVAQGQQNTTIKYVMYIFLGVAAAVAIYAINKKG